MTMGFYPRPMPFPPCAPRHCGPPVRECHKDFKELLVVPRAREVVDPVKPITEIPAANVGVLAGANATAVARTLFDGTRSDIIGGGCCVHLSVEYMPASPEQAQSSTTGKVTVTVVDSENATLTWSKSFTEGYHVKENIITTHPGATLTIGVVNAIARVRWCEIYSG